MPTVWKALSMNLAAGIGAIVARLHRQIRHSFDRLCPVLGHCCISRINNLGAACLALLVVAFQVPLLHGFFQLGSLDPAALLRVACFTAIGGYLQFIVVRRPRLLS